MKLPTIGTVMLDDYTPGPLDLGQVCDDLTRAIAVLDECGDGAAAHVKALSAARHWASRERVKLEQGKVTT